ncbi:MAG: hypothetical protein JWO31_2503, partial [Phycisphaerales bacterium]|nr:hypothetical protein [Phycisphaerales bacterium]
MSEPACAASIRVSQRVRVGVRRRWWGGVVARRIWAAAALAALLGPAGAVPARAATVDPVRVDTAVVKAINWLYAQQKPAGNWETDPARKGTEHAWQTMQGETFGGYTALCTFALLEAGEKPTDPRLAKAIEFLRKCDLFGTYATGLRCMVFSKLPADPENRILLKADANRLIEGAIKTGPGTGLWDYDSNRPGGRPDPSGKVDLSCSQFAVLGLWSAAQAGVPIPPNVWTRLDGIWRGLQRADGAWSYDGAENGVRVTMTGAGVATLLIVQDILGGTAAAMAPGGVDPNIGRGIVSLDKNFDEADPLGAYAWYAYERIGTAGGYRYLGRHDWYDRGAAALVKKQLPDGSWPAGGAAGMAALPETALSVLFLAHGRTPVLLSKLNYSGAEIPGRDASWNRRPRDAANLVKFVTSATEVPYGWQVVSTAAPPEDLLSVPVLLLAGAGPVVLTEREREKLRLYVEGGGLIVAAAEGARPAGVPVGNDEFSRSIVDFGRRGLGGTFRELPPTHPIFTEQQFRPRTWAEKPTVWGLSNGVRELVVLLPDGDFGRAWQAGSHEKEPVKFQLGVDLTQYAVSRQPVPGPGRGHVVRPSYVPVVTTQPAEGMAGG